MSTRLRLEKQLLRRIPELKNIKIIGNGGYRIFVSDREGNSSPELIQKVKSIADQYSSAGWPCFVQPFKELPDEEYEGLQLDPAQEALAIYGDVTRNGFIEAIIKLFPEIKELEFSEGLPPGSISLFVSYNANVDQAQFDERLKTVVRELLIPGLQLSIHRYSEFGNPRDKVEAYWRGHLRPQLKSDPIMKADRLQKDRFAGEADSVFKKPESFSLPFKTGGNKIFYIPGIESVPLTTLLPFYDHIFIQIPPRQKIPDADEFLKEMFGLNLNELLLLIRKQRVIPVFKFSYTFYPSELIEPLLSEVLTHIGPKDLDLLALQTSSRWNDPLQLNPQKAASLYALIEGHRGKKSTKREEFLAYYQMREELDFLIDMPDQMIPYFFDRGHLALSLFTPVPFYLRFTEKFLLDAIPGLTSKEIKERFGFFSINLHGSVTSIGLADSLGATVCDGLTHAPVVTKVAADLLQGSSQLSILPSNEIELLTSFLKGVGIAYSDSIDMKAYEKIFDASEVRRMRHDLGQLIGQDIPEYAKIEKVKELVSQYNSEIRSFANKDKYHLGEAFFDLSAQISSQTGGNGWSGIIGAGFKLLHKNSNALMEDFYSTPAGDVVNVLRGALAFKSPHSIRLHHLKRKIEGSMR